MTSNVIIALFISGLLGFLLNRIAALTCGAVGEPQVRRLSRQVKCLVPAQGDGTRPNEVSAAIPGDAVAGNRGHQQPLLFVVC